MSEKSLNDKLKDIEAQIKKSKEDVAETVAVSKELPRGEGWWSVSSAMTISSLVLVFGLVICLLASRLLSKGYSADSILKTFGTVLVIISAVFLVVAGYSDKQISPVIGLLGTIVGYLLGRNTNDSKV